MFLNQVLYVLMHIVLLYFETSASMAIAEFLMYLALAHQRTLLKFDTFLLSVLKSEFMFDRKRN